MPRGYESAKPTKMKNDELQAVRALAKKTAFLTAADTDGEFEAYFDTKNHMHVVMLTRFEVVDWGKHTIVQNNMTIHGALQTDGHFVPEHRPLEVVPMVRQYRAHKKKLVDTQKKARAALRQSRLKKRAAVIDTMQMAVHHVNGEEPEVEQPPDDHVAVLADFVVRGIPEGENVSEEEDGQQQEAAGGPEYAQEQAAAGGPQDAQQREDPFYSVPGQHPAPMVA